MKRVPALAVLAAVAGGATACASEPGALDPSSGEARALAVLFWAMVAVGGAIALGVMALNARAARVSAVPDDRRNRRIVVGGGIVLPVAVLVPLSAAMFAVASAHSNRSRPVDLRIEVTGHQYWWEIRYPQNGAVTANEIHLPVGADVELVLRTADVIHSVWVPQLAGKIDMIPGETTQLRIRTDQPGSTAATAPSSAGCSTRACCSS